MTRQSEMSNVVSITGRTPRLRREVAVFAGYCVGSAHGDWDTRVMAEERRVLDCEKAFAHWLAEYRRHQAWGATGSGQPFDDPPPDAA